MHILADENFPGTAVKVLIRAGHDVIWIRTAAPEMPDEKIFDWAIREDRVILTFDKDFGEIASRTPATPRCGVILLRKPLPPILEVGAFVLQILERQTDWHGYLSVIEGDRVRRRPLILGSI